MSFAPEHVERPDAAHALAQRAAAAMWAADRASQAAGMAIDAVGPGTATLRMTVREDMVNGHGICHGGYLFLLADSTFAFACNSYNLTTVAQSCDIAFLAPARLGDVLVAEAAERSRAGRTGIYDITVRRENGDGSDVVAEFRGRSRTIPGTVAPAETETAETETDTTEGLT
jgi:phenylacetic acid degradation protein PaaD